MNKKTMIIGAIVIALIVGLLVIVLCLNNGKENANNNPSTNVETNNSKKKEDKKDEKKQEEVVVTIGDETHKLSSETNVGSIYYLENYVDFNTDRYGNTKMMSYNYNGAFSFEVRINYEEEHSIDEVKAMLSEYTESKKEINGITYSYYEYKSNLGDDTHYYLYDFNGKPCSIIFFLGDTPGNIEEVFMNNVRFK